MQKKVIYSALYPGVYPFESLGQEHKAAREPDDLKEHDSMLVVWGGADIHPAYYKHPMHHTTYPGGLRDKLEWSLMNAAMEKGIPIIGICRGAQMLCALNGGFLLQDVRNHGMRHEVSTHDNKAFMVNSLHHQMMCGLERVDHELVAWREGRMGMPYGYMDDKVYSPDADWKEPEFVYFKGKARGYAVQWHPEMMERDVPATEYILNFINNKEEEHGNGYAYQEVNLSHS